MVGHLPISARRKLEEVKGRYEVDLEVLKRVLVRPSSYGRVVEMTDAVVDRRRAFQDSNDVSVLHLERYASLGMA